MTVQTNQRPKGKPYWRVVERNNHLALHALLYSREAAERHVKYVIVSYVARGLFTNKTLVARDFVIMTPQGDIVDPWEQETNHGTTE